MFTGIVETTGRIISLEKNFLTIEAPSIASRLKRGGSIAVDGVCLTSLTEGGHVIKAEVMPETLERTNLGDREIGSFVNLELPLSATGRFDGHMVLGHVDGVGEVTRIESYHNAHILSIRYPEALDRYIVQKGSIAISGISLTVISVMPSVETRDLASLQMAFTVGIIPHTWNVTNLRYLKIGDSVNIETDILGKYFEKWSAKKS